MRTPRRKSAPKAPKKPTTVPAHPVHPVIVAPPSINDILSAPLLRVPEVARLLQVTERTIYTYIDAGLLERVKIGNQTTRVTNKSLQKLIAPAVG
jgi:excisionase family DNA binding protein